VRVLVTGITGFVGSHLAEYALTRGAEVYGSSLWRSKTDNSSVHYPAERDVTGSGVPPGGPALRARVLAETLTTHTTSQ
jgi:nucleoside-diphosphate-sugar epimerase